MAEDGCRLLLEHKCSDSATDLGQQMLELYTDAKIEESEESLGESACHEGSSHRRHGGYCCRSSPLFGRRAGWLSRVACQRAMRKRSHYVASDRPSSDTLQAPCSASAQHIPRRMSWRSRP